MTLALLVTIRSKADIELAMRPVSGRPWLARLIERLRCATSIERVVIACREGVQEIAALVESINASVIVTDDPVATARELVGDDDGVVFCPVAQLFADPVRLDALAALALPADATGARAVLSCDPSITLTGGAFLEIVTRVGLRATVENAGERPGVRKIAAWPTQPEPPELRLQLKTWGDADWAVRAEEALLAQDPSGDLVHFESALRAASLQRFPFWDGVALPPQSIFTIRCFRLPLFEHFLRYLSRVHGAEIDVVCRAEHAEETRALDGVGRVITFDGPTFSLEALGRDSIDAIRARHYDLCVIPRREPTGWGFENVTELAGVSGACTAIWLDIFGRSGLLAGQWQGWDAESIGGPHERGAAYLRRAVRALDRYETTPSTRSTTQIAAVG